MTIDGVFHIRNRGTVITMTLDGTIPEVGCKVRRGDDEWTVVGIERHPLPRALRVGDRVGLLLSGDAVPAEGDDVTLILPA